MIERSFTTKDEQEFIDLFNRFCELSRDKFNVTISQVLYSKITPLACVRFNTIHTIPGVVSFESEKSFKRRYFQMITDTVQDAIIKDLQN